MSVEEWEAQKAASQRSASLAAGGVGAALLLGGALWAVGVFDPTPEGVVTDYLDAVVSGEPTGDYLSDWEVGNPVERKIVRGYELMNSSGDVVSATVIFQSKANTDLPKTLRFTVEEGKIAQIE